MSKRKRLLSFTVSFLLVLSLAGCFGDTGADADQPPADTDTPAGESSPGGGDSTKPIVIANKADIKTLDPHAINEVIHSRPTRHIFSKLVRLTSDLEYVPDLAESWEYLSDTEIVFHLRQDVKWHDGTDFKASDVLFSFERQRTMPAGAYLLDPVADIIADDEYTIRILLSNPYAPIMANLAHVCSAIVPEKAVTELGDDFALNPVGTGSMKFVEIVTGDRVVLTRNEDYYGEMAKAPGLIFKCMPEDGARSIALETGEIDMDPEVAFQDVERVTNNDDLSLYEWPTIFVEEIIFNTKKDIISDKRVRQAIAHAIDRDSIVQVVLEGHGRATDTVLPIGVLGHTEDYPKYEFNPEKAKELLAEAGYADGFSVSITAYDAQREREATIIQANLAAIGITVDIDMMERAAVLEAYAGGTHEMAVESWGNGTGDPEGTLFVSFFSEMQGSAGNRCWYENPDVDAALMRGRGTVDTDERAAAYSDAVQLIMEDLPWIPLYNKHFVVGTQAGLKGIDEHPTGYDSYDMLHYE